MHGTEEELEKQMRERMKEVGKTGAQIAEELGVKPPHVSRILSRQSGKIPESLIDVLDTLDLEITTRRKR